MERTESHTFARIVLVGIVIVIGGAILFAHHAATERAKTAANRIQPPTKYTNYVYKVSLNYPSTWQPTEGYNYDHYNGSDGFFGISAAASSTNIDALAEREAKHVLKPYGSSPVVGTFALGSLQARIIMPSSDQDSSMHDQAEIVVKYPTPTTVGGETYSYFILLADKAHIQEIGKSLKFVQ